MHKNTHIQDGYLKYQTNFFMKIHVREQNGLEDFIIVLVCLYRVCKIVVSVVV